MKRKIEFWIGKEKIIGDLHLPEKEGEVPCVVTSHGYDSNRKGEKYVQIGHRFPLEGIAVVRFDHRGAIGGDSGGEFGDTTLTKRVEDLKAAINYLAKIKEIDCQRIGLLGSSMGGMTILALPKDERIKAITLLATPVCYSEIKIEVPKKLSEDVKKYDLQKEAEKIHCPTLIIHGTLDEVVPSVQAKVLFETIGSEIKELKLIKGGDHAFSDPQKLKEVLKLSLEWFKKYLK